MSGPRDWSPHGASRPGVVRRTLPVLLVFALLLGALFYLRDDLRELIGTAPGSARSAVATHLLYEKTGPVGGRCPGLPKDLDADPDTTLNVLARCLDRMWSATLEPAGFDYEPPAEMRLVATPEEAACGIDDFDWAGIYCSGERIVNVLVEDDGEERDTFPMMFTLAHEYAHHVQQITGIADQNGSEVFDEAWSRRLELQADCLAAAALRNVHPYLLNDLRRGAAVEPDEADAGADAARQSHGSGASGARWMLRGQQKGTLAGCNTWKAPAEEVS
ncbi:peptidase [Planomonospora sphaerica]|uniref:Peptidase n=1 Tax=Planomonospora sphaerica TaxID=161355 RepID=A0A171BPB9_9ACTN|nr:MULTISPECIES: neutral zinc metallopeptidase [Planomonospora]GAT65395.1 peptidase [Planomonospora sphaerica]